MGKQSFDRKLEAVTALRATSPEQALPELRRTLGDRNNFLVGRAAVIVAERCFAELIPELLLQFERFLIDPVKADPQCWAKNEIARALVALQHRGPSAFLRGICHVQMEPVFGGKADSAISLRGICAVGLVNSNLSPFEVLEQLTDLLNDPETPARMDAARAMAELGAPEGALPLRLKLLVGDREPEVIGACFSAVLALSPAGYLPFVARWLADPDVAARLEAAAALIESRLEGAFPFLEEFWNNQTDGNLKLAFLKLLGAASQEKAAGMLLSIIETAPVALAGPAIREISQSRFALPFRTRVQAAVAARQTPSLQTIWQESCPAD